MEREIAFHTLGIAETKEEHTIRMAYFSLLKQTNPEDDPEGFKRLREAYETAAAYAGEHDREEEIEADKTEVELWLDRVLELYSDIGRRRCTNEWSALLQEPVCTDLDTAEEARLGMIRFLMAHNHLPRAVWQLLEQAFHFVAECEELKEHFHVNFLNYMKYYVENENFIDFDLFRILDPEKQNADKYLNQYFDIKRKLDQNDGNHCLEKLAELKAFGLYFPYEDVERMRCYLCNEQVDKAVELGTKLLTDYPKDNYVKAWYGETLEKAGRKEEAFGLWQEILKEEPLYYVAKMGSIRYQMEQNNYYEAREMAQDILTRNSQDQDARQYLTECNNFLITDYRDKLAAGRPDPNLSEKEMQIEIGWCLFQNEQITEAIESVRNLQPDEALTYDYSNLFGRLLVEDMQYERARPFLETWLRLITETVDDGTEKNKKRISRKNYALNILARCLHELGEETLAEDYLRQAIENSSQPEERLGTMNYLAAILSQQKQYERAIDLCDKIIWEDANYFPAYVTRQEASYELKRGHDVINDYYRAVDIFPGYYKPYLLAAEVFFYFGQYSDGKEVLERARENQIPFTDRMKLFDVKLLRNLAESRKDREAPMRILLELNGTRGSESDITDESEIDFEMAMLDWDNNELEQSLLHMKNAIDKNPERLQYRLVRGHIYLDAGRYRDARSEFGRAEESYYGDPSLHYSRGICYEQEGLKKLAKEAFEKTLEFCETYRDACEKVARYYWDQYDNRNQEEDFEKAISYINRELREKQIGYFLVFRGRLYLRAQQFERAAADFKQALADNPDDWSAYNNLGCYNQYIGQYDKAIECFRQAAACMKEQKTMLPYSNMANCYEILGQYQDAIQCYERNLNLFPEHNSYWGDIGDLFLCLGDLSNARKAFGHMKENIEYHLKIANMYEHKGQRLRALIAYLKRIVLASFTNRKMLGKCYDDLGEFTGHYMPFLTKMACTYAIKYSNDLHEQFLYEQKLSTHYYRSGNVKAAKQLAETALKTFAKTGEKEANYIAYKPYAPVRLRIMALIYMALGEREKCETYFEQMGEVGKCFRCRRRKCHEQYFYRGIYREAIGDLNEAMEDYKMALEIDPTLKSAEHYITTLRKKMEKGNDNRN